ncbi:hypothetical protein GE09DRAFT_32293 [Coniochaeta sp. 2T2.1]|nr:hypothetical protein GE09DRAFT_32293 [Coniochaeta sp. 2T2.1]
MAWERSAVAARLMSIQAAGTEAQHERATRPLRDQRLQSAKRFCNALRRRLNWASEGTLSAGDQTMTYHPPVAYMSTGGIVASVCILSLGKQHRVRRPDTARTATLSCRFETCLIRWQRRAAVYAVVCSLHVGVVQHTPYCIFVRLLAQTSLTKSDLLLLFGLNPYPPSVIVASTAVIIDLALLAEFEGSTITRTDGFLVIARCRKRASHYCWVCCDHLMG